MQSCWPLLQVHVLTHEPEFFHTALVWGPENKARGLILVTGQIKHRFPKHHNSQMEATSDHDAKKTHKKHNNCPLEEDLSILALALREAEKKKKKVSLENL